MGNVIHAPNEHKTLCGIEADKSRFGLFINNNPANVTCKNCLKKMAKK